MSFYALQVTLEYVYYALAQEPNKFFWTRLEKLPFAVAGKRLERVEERVNLWLIV